MNTFKQLDQTDSNDQCKINVRWISHIEIDLVSMVGIIGIRGFIM